MQNPEELDDADRRRPLRRLYAWTIRNAQGRHAWLSLGGVSFAESSFFPIPPDVMLIPMALADRKRALPSRPCSRLPGVAIRATMLKEIQVHLGNVGSNYLTTDRNLI